jgi:acyl homoserine lactone synthase
MFTLVYGDDLFDFPQLANEMFHDRRAQFKEALGWNLAVDALGREIDEYDLLNPLYVILRDGDGRHLGSSRVLPTTGRTMIADHFSDLTDGVEIESPLIWETTRFFIARRGAESRRNAAALMWAGCQLGLRAGVQFYVGVTAAHMVRVFTACGWPAEVIGRRTDPDGEICACLWEVNDEMCDRLRRRAGIEQGQYALQVYRRPAGRPAGQTNAPAQFAEGTTRHMSMTAA